MPGLLRGLVHATFVQSGSFVLWLALFPIAATGTISKSIIPTVDPVAVGHVQHWMDPDSKHMREIITLSTDPPVFSLPRILSEEESDQVIGLAQQTEWEKSEVEAGPDRARNLQGGEKRAYKYLRKFDIDRNGFLNEGELSHLAQELYDVVDYNHSAFKAHVSRQHKVSSNLEIPLKVAARSRIHDFFMEAVKAEPQLLSRFSNQVWLTHTSPVVKTLLRRAENFSGLPAEIIRRSEDIQVVNYPKHGHYSCHHDSSPDNIDEGNYRIATLAIFLNNVSKGGELAFPGALHQSKTAGWSEHEWADLESRCQPINACANMGGLVVQPRKGDGIFWYNLEPRVVQSLLQFPNLNGNRDVKWNSLHCGAPVVEGEKWLANLWFRNEPPHSRDEL